MPGGVQLFIGCVKLVLLVVVLTASSAFAHPGRTAADGCHYCRTNCAQWGEAEGARHCHGQPSRARQNGQSPARPPQAAPDHSRTNPVEILGSVPRIVDADTLEVAGQKVRLQGIDAPESAQSCRQAGGHRYPCGGTPLRRSGRGSARTRSPARLRAGTATGEGWGFSTPQTART